MAAASKKLGAVAAAAKQPCYVALQTAPFPLRPKVLGILPQNLNTDTLYEANLREDGYLSKQNIENLGLKAPPGPRVWIVPAEILSWTRDAADKENAVPEPAPMPKNTS